jgi:hypothetical protein
MSVEHPLRAPSPPLLSFRRAARPRLLRARRLFDVRRVCCCLSHPLRFASSLFVLSSAKCPARTHVAPLAAQWSLSQWTDGHKAPSGGHKHTQDTKYTRMHTGHASKRAPRMVPAPCASPLPPPSRPAPLSSATEWPGLSVAAAVARKFGSTHSIQQQRHGSTGNERVE